MLIHCSCLTSSVLFPLLPLVFQVGVLYFRVPRQVQIFGIASEGTPQQLNYLVDEDQTIGTDGSKAHGANAVVSMLHHHLEDNITKQGIITYSYDDS